MRTPFVAVSLGFVMLLAMAPAFAGGNVNFTYGTRTLDDEDYWDPVDEPGFYGLTVDFGQDSWPLNIAIGYHQSNDDGNLTNIPLLGAVDAESTINEWSVGAHKEWRLKNPARPFIGGGLTHVETEAEITSALGDTDDDDSGDGVYLEGGVFFRLAEALNLGVEGRLTEGTDITLFDTDGDADYYQFGVLLGFGWPSRK